MMLSGLSYTFIALVLFREAVMLHLLHWFLRRIIPLI